MEKEREGRSGRMVALCSFCFENLGPRAATLQTFPVTKYTGQLICLVILCY